jgi:hypothetical protein
MPQGLGQIVPDLIPRAGAGLQSGQGPVRVVLALVDLELLF